MMCAALPLVPIALDALSLERSRTCLSVRQVAFHVAQLGGPPLQLLLRRLRPRALLCDS